MILCVFRAEAQSVGLRSGHGAAGRPAVEEMSPNFEPAVEEDKWPEIPCTSSRISSGAAPRAGPARRSVTGGMGRRTALSIDASNCRMAHDLVFTDTGNLISRRCIVADPYLSAPSAVSKACYAHC
jgi:hypothetical protein